MRTLRRRLNALAVLGTLAVSLALPAAALAAYGAIAINPTTGSWGVSVHAGTRGSAERRAKRECHGRCRVLLWVRNECAAAVETPTRFWGGWGPNRKAAITSARRHAHQRHAHLLAWTCSG
jgi:uncharacterized protein DUF4189